MGRALEIVVGLVAALLSFIPFLLNLLRSLFTIGGERLRVMASLESWDGSPVPLPDDAGTEPFTVYAIAGEASGDRLGAEVVDALAAREGNVRVRGYGGERMAAAGARLDEDLASHAVMGVTAVLAQAPRIVRLYAEYLRVLDEERPDVVLLVDYPGFNLRAGRAARRRGIPVVWYVAPQIWAWAPWRARRIAAAADRILVILPFERAFYAERGIEVDWVGYPLFADRDREPPDEALAASLRAGEGPVLALLPGSRRKEVRQNLAGLLEVVDGVRARCPTVRPVVAAASPRVRRAIEEGLGGRDDVLVVDGNARTVLAVARAAACVSGTVTMDCAHAGVPAVVAYRLGAVARLLKPLVVTSPFVAMANLLAGEEVYPETHDPGGDAERLSGHLAACLEEGDTRRRVTDALARLRERLTDPGAPARVAAALRQAATAGVDSVS